jgi:REP element-mobilizing transposase RayT
VLQESDDTGKKSASIETIVKAFKRLTTKEIGYSIWQTSFFEHVIRNTADIQRVSDYIDANPRRWRTDKS